MMERRTGSPATLRRVSRPAFARAEAPPDALEAEFPAPPAAGGQETPLSAALRASRSQAAAPASAPFAAAPVVQEQALPAAPESTSVGISEFGQILARRWKTIAATTLLVSLLGAGFAFFAPKKYTASTSLLIDPRNRAAFQIEVSGMPAPYDPNLVDSQTVLIESETVLRRVVASEKLAQDSEFSRGVGDAASNALRNLKEAVKVKRPDRTYVVDVQVRTGDAAKSARIANAVARAFLSDGSESKTDVVNREQGWLDKHLQGLEQRLRAAEARVDEYKTRNRIFGSPGGLVGEQQLSEINRALSDAQRKAAEAKATLDQVDALRRSGRVPDATNEALRSGAIERLRTQQAEILRLEANSRSTLGPRHPASIEVREQLAEVQRQITQELARISENARSSYAVARANVAGLERELERLKTNNSQTSHTLLGLRELERAVEAQKAVYEKFLRDKEAIARLSVETPAGRVIQVAEPPPAASFPNRPLVLALSLVAGLFLGVGLALLLETLARGRGVVAGAGAGTVAPGTPFSLGRKTMSLGHARPGQAARLLASLPAGLKRGIFGKTPAPPAPDAVLSAPQSPYAQAVMTLATRVMPDKGTPATLMVSGVEAGSTNPLLALNLALALGLSGRRVLLVDGHGGAGSLTQMLAAHGTPVAVMLAGARQSALSIETGTGTPLCLLPFGAAPRGRVQASARMAPPEITLIDGPALRSAAFGKLDLEGAIDGVLVALPPGLRAPDKALSAELEERLGPALTGLVGQGI